MVLSCKGCPQRLICQALLYPNSAGNTPAFRSFQKAPPNPCDSPFNTPTGAKTNLSSDWGHHTGGLSFPVQLQTRRESHVLIAHVYDLLIRVIILNIKHEKRCWKTHVLGATFTYFNAGQFVKKLCYFWVNST